jgi:hypothetical protein
MGDRNQLRFVCRLATSVFLLLYLVAVLLFVLGTLGLYGVDRDPLSGFYLLPLGLPWNLWIDSLPEAPWLWAGVLASAVNLRLMILICSAASRRFAPSGH